METNKPVNVSHESVTSTALTFHLHLLGNLVDVILRSSVGEDHEDVGDAPPDSSLFREDVFLHMLDGST